jgi:protein gp37
VGARGARECQAAGVAFFFKQWGTFGADGVRRSKKANGRELAGRLWEQYPDEH